MAPVISFTGSLWQRAWKPCLNAYQISPVFLCDPCGERCLRFQNGKAIHSPRGTQGFTGEKYELHFRPKVGSGVFWIQLGQLAEQFFRALVSWHWDVDGDLHNLIASDALSRC